MSMPFFTPGHDPGPDFPALLQRVGLSPYASTREGSHPLDVTQATTCVAVRFAGGVVMAGDPRATSGNLISPRGMEKVMPADRWSAGAIAGAAGPATEVGKAYQLQTEDHEKSDAI